MKHQCVDGTISSASQPASRKRRVALAVIVAALALTPISLPAGPAKPRLPKADQARSDRSSIPFMLDAQRILLEVQVEKPDGSARTALAWFNMGMPGPVLSKPLYRELEIGEGHPLMIRLGSTKLLAAPASVTNGDSEIDGDKEFDHYFAPYSVEMVLPAVLFKDSVVKIDYAKHVIEIGTPETSKKEGQPVSLSYNPETGFSTVDVVIDGSRYPFVLDAGSGYTWMRGEVLGTLLDKHTDWRRAYGAVGQSNNAMVDFDFEKEGTVARLPEVGLGPVTVKDVGVLGTAPLLGTFGDAVLGNLFWDKWQTSASGPVVGWIGGNVLRQFKVTLDYPNRVAYLMRQVPADAHDLDQVGITLIRKASHYYVGGLVRPVRTAQDKAAPDFRVGDEVVTIDGMPVRGATKQSVLKALHGRAGEIRNVVVERGGRQISVDAPVLAFD